LCARGWKENRLFELPVPAADSHRGTKDSPFSKKWASASASRQRKADNLQVAGTTVEPPASSHKKPAPKTTPTKIAASTSKKEKKTSTPTNKAAKEEDKDQIIADLRRQIEELKKARNQEIILSDDEEEDPRPVPPKHPSPAEVVERDKEPYSVGMYEGLDEIATADLYNFLGSQLPAMRGFFSKSTSFKFKLFLDDTKR
jgi:hypothetical protein